MLVFAFSWLATSLSVLNLGKLPATEFIVAFAGLWLIVLLKFRSARKMAAGVFCSVITLSIAFYQISQQQLPAELVSKNIDITVQIASVPQIDGHKSSFLAHIIACDSCVVPLGVRNVRLSWFSHTNIVQAGERWQFTVKLKPPRGLRNPGSFDTSKWALSREIHASGYVSDQNGAVRLSGQSVQTLAYFRERAQQSLNSLSTVGNTISLVEALTLGIKSSVSEKNWQLLQDTGTAHLLAISGLHITLVAGWSLLAGRWIFSVALRPLAQKHGHQIDPRSFALLLSLAAAMAYAALAGFELPTQRAVVMLAVWAVASWRFRILAPASGLASALIIILIFNALGPLSVGFWLSFGAVAALFYLHSGHQHNGHQRTLPDMEIEAAARARIITLVRRLGAATRTHICLGIILLPMTAWFFQSGSLVAPLANLVAVPWVGIVCVPLCLIALALSFYLPGIAGLVLAMAQYCLQLLLGWLTWIDDSVPSTAIVTVPDALAMGLTVTGLIVTFSPKGLGYRWLAVPLFLPVLAFNYQQPHDSGFEIHVLDVGQGLSTLVFTQNQTLLYDTGGKVSSRLSMVEAAVMPFLHARGRRSIDVLVLSHLDEDHAYGMGDVLRRFPDAAILASQYPAGLSEEYNVDLCRAGEDWRIDGVSFAFLHPAQTSKNSANDHSCVLLIYQGQSRAVFTGDIEESGETQLLQNMESEFGVFPVDLIVAPHHGSNSSSGQKLLEFFRPGYVVFSAGARNRYGFPHRDVKLRYKISGATPFTTGEQGSVSFSFDENGLRSPPETWWHSHRRFWHGIVNPDCWQLFVGQSQLLRLLTLAQKGQTLCGK